MMYSLEMLTRKRKFGRFGRSILGDLGDRPAKNPRKIAQIAQIARVIPPTVRLEVLLIIVIVTARLLSLPCARRCDGHVQVWGPSANHTV